METTNVVLTAESFGTTDAEVIKMTSSSDEMLFDSDEVTEEWHQVVGEQVTGGDFVEKEDDEAVSYCQSLFETSDTGIYLVDETTPYGDNVTVIRWAV